MIKRKEPNPGFVPQDGFPADKRIADALEYMAHQAWVTNEKLDLIHEQMVMQTGILSRKS